MFSSDPLLSICFQKSLVPFGWCSLRRHLDVPGSLMIVFQLIFLPSLTLLSWKRLIILTTLLALPCGPSHRPSQAQTYAKESGSVRNFSILGAHCQPMAHTWGQRPEAWDTWIPTDLFACLHILHVTSTWIFLKMLISHLVHTKHFHNLGISEKPWHPRLRELLWVF